MKEICDRISGYKDQTCRYLISLSEKHIDEDISKAVMAAQNICTSFGRIGELIRTSGEVRFGLALENKGFSEAGSRDLDVFVEAVGEIVEATVMDFEYGSFRLTKSISVFREMVSQLHSMVNNRHIRRLHDGICDRQMGKLFMDMCYDLEKIIDECDTIAANLLPFILSGSSARVVTEDEHKEPGTDKIKELYKDKYMALLDNK